MTAVVGLGSFLGTIATYLASKRLYGKWRALLLSPLLVTPAVLAVVLLLMRLPYPAYMAGASWLGDLLGPATVAFAVPIYRNRELVRRYALPMASGAVAGAVAGLLSSLLLASWLHLSPEMARTLAPRSVTTPIAMEISQRAGGIPALTAVCVVVTGLWGTVAGPLLLRWLPLRSPVARGVLFGAGAHGAGTMKAFEFGSLEGTFSSLAMIATAFATLALTPVALAWLHV